MFIIFLLQNLTSAINQYVDGHPTYKYPQITDFIYKAVFKENAKEYREVLKLDSKDNVRHTLYAEVLLVISSFENGVGAAISELFQKLDKEQVLKQNLYDVNLDTS